jgi:FtsP/CotA-like multicopper oxidase with cupredoxin domain
MKHLKTMVKMNRSTNSWEFLPEIKSKFRNIHHAFDVVLMILALVVISASVKGQCPGTDVIQDPEEFIWTYHPADSNNPEAYYSGIMEVGEVTVTFNNGETLTTRAYRQQGGSYSVPGPTIRVVPGNKYVLSLHNTLPYAPLDPGHNVFKDPNVVNIHTHGLHISGESPGDDVTRAFEGQRGGDFVWDIPEDHMGGTFWYHAHHHGSTLLQVAGGMFGMLIVDDNNDGLPANVAGMEEKILAIGFVDPAVAGTGGDQLISGTLASTWTVNGTIQGNICIPENTWQHWRVLIADPAAKLRDVEFGPGIEVKVMGRDGVWRTEVPKDLHTNILKLTGASRADFAVRLNAASSWIKVGNVTVANIYADGTPDLTVNPYSADGVTPWNPIRPDYLRDLRNEPSVHNESISMGARTVGGSNYSGKYEHHTPNVIQPATDVQEWTLSGNVNHPFHLHVYHVQAMESDRDFEEGEYYDVVASQMEVRFDLNASTSTPYEGRTIFHCHILAHEDLGAMGWLDVQGGQSPPTFPADGNLAQPYSAYYMLSGTQQPPTAPGNLTAAAISSSAIELTWDDNSLDEDGFDIERSADGINFNLLTSVGTNVVAYSDNGLSSSTTYWYRVSAYNTGGSSATSNIADAITQAPGGGPEVHVESITVISEALKGNRFGGVATVTIFDGLGVAVSGATVTGDFSGPNSSIESGTTDVNGQVSFNSKAEKNPAGEWCFEVTDITVPGGTYNSAANVVTQACESGPVFKAMPSAYSASNGSARLVRVYPNPIKNDAQILFELDSPSVVTIEVYSILGDRLAVITDQSYSAGQHTIRWAPENLGNGSYFMKLSSANNQIDFKRFLLIR